MVIAKVPQDALERVVEGLGAFDARVDDEDREHVFVRHEFALPATDASFPTSKPGHPGARQEPASITPSTGAILSRGGFGQAPPIWDGLASLVFTSSRRDLAGKGPGPAA